MSFTRSLAPTLRQAARAAGPVPALRAGLSSTSSSRSAFDSALAQSASQQPTATSSRLPASLPSFSGSASAGVPTPLGSGALPEANADSELLQVLSRLVMRDGKLARAHSHLATMLSHLALQTQSPPMALLHRAIELAAPSIRVVGRRKGTKSLPTPQPLTAPQRRRQAWLWIVEASEKRQGSEKVFGRRLAQEVLAVLGGQSEAIKKRESRHQQGVTGRANVGR